MRIARFTTGEDPVYGLVDGAGEKIAEITGDPLYQKIELTGATHLVADVRLLAPVIPRSKVIGIGRNYADHAAEMGGEVPVEPMMFLIPNTAVVGPGEPVVMPPQTSEVHYEGSCGRHRPPLQGPRAGGGRQGHLRVHLRQRRDRARPAARRRAVGACQGLRHLLPARALDRDRPRPHRPVAGHPPRREVVQDGTTADMVHGVAAVISHASKAFTLLPGDVILTGTPAGVGPVESGQRVAVEVEGIGVLENPFVRR